MRSVRPQHKLYIPNRLPLTADPSVLKDDIPISSLGPGLLKVGTWTQDYVSWLPSLGVEKRPRSNFSGFLV